MSQHPVRLLTTLPLIQCMETVGVIHLTRQIEACQRLYPDEGHFALVPVSGGVAAMSKPAYTRKLNHLVGFGMNGSVTEADLSVLLHASDHIIPEIDLCPLAHPTALQALTAAGWNVNGFLSVYAYALDAPCPSVGMQGDIRIEKASCGEKDKFVQASIDGFRDGGRSTELLSVLANSAANRSDTTLYFAMIGDAVVATAAMAVIETTTGPVAHLYIDSTISQWRGRGIHAALINTRLRDAKELGCTLATLDARPGSASSRSAERAGFRLAYTKATFTQRPLQFV